MAVQVTVMSLDIDSDREPRISRFQKNEISIGRSKDNDIVIEHPEVSSHHAKLKIHNDKKRNEDSLVVLDLGSLNGTRVENIPIPPNKEIELSRHDRVRVGNFLIKPELVEGKALKSDIEIIDTELETKNTDESKPEPPAPAPEPEPEIAPPADEPVEVAAPTEDLEATAPSPRKQLVAAILKGKSSNGNSSFSGRISSTAPDSIDFMAIRLFKLSGKVLHHGKPLGNVEIDAAGLGKATTRADGSFEILDVPEGTEYTLKAVKSNYIISCSDTQGIINGDHEITFEALQLFTVRGKVTHHGKPLEGVAIDGGNLGQTTTGPDGTYSFADVPENTEFTITAMKKGYLIKGLGEQAESIPQSDPLPLPEEASEAKTSETN